MLQLKIVAKSPHIGTRLKGSGVATGEMEAVAPSFVKMVLEISLESIRK